MDGICGGEKVRRFFAEKADIPVMRLTGDERRHLADVLRARQGERIIVCPNDGYDYVYEITAFDKSSVTLSFVSREFNLTEPSLFLCAYIALLKGDKTEFEVQKLTELGVRRIVPFISERTVCRSEKSVRLRRAAHEASKQCGRAVIPDITETATFEEVLAELRGYDSVVFSYEGAYGNGKRINEVINGGEKRVALVTGPEGGFSDGEVARAADEGFCGVTLGKRILRAETAAIAGAAVIMQLCGEWK